MGLIFEKLKQVVDESWFEAYIGWTNNSVKDLEMKLAEKANVKEMIDVIETKANSMDVNLVFEKMERRIDDRVEM